MKRVLITIAVILLLGVSIGVLIYFNRKEFPENPAEASGNLAGNLYNGGYFCEYQGEVFYSNVFDNYYIYRIKKDQSVVKENIVGAFSLNIYNGYLYYSKNTKKTDGNWYLSGTPYGVYRVDLKSNRTKCLTTVLCPYITLCGNTIVLQEYTNTSLYLSEIDTDKKDGIVRIAGGNYVVACSDSGYVYYVEKDGNSNNIYRYSPKTKRSSLVFRGNCFQPICIGDILFYIDVEDNYKLKRTLLSSGTTQVISSERCVNYNTDGSVIYYEVENSPSGAFGLYRCDIDGNNVVQISEQACKNINITSDYTYFMYFQDDKVWRRVPTRGSVLIEEFSIVLE